MKKFEVCMRGRNFLIKSDKQVMKKGFLTARFIEADDISSAVEMATASIRADLKDAVQNDKSDPPKLNVEEINEVYYFGDSMLLEKEVVPGNSFIWYKEGEPEEYKKPLSAWRGGWPLLRESFKIKDAHVHTMSIHFTNALYPVAILFMFFYLLFGKASFHQTYFYLMLVATVSAPLSYLTGILEWKRKFEGAMIPIFLTKIRYGLVPFIIGGCCTIWYCLSPGVLGDRGTQTVAFIILNILILPPLIYLGKLGGIIVYEGTN